MSVKKNEPLIEAQASPLLNGLRVTFSQVRGFVTVASTGSFTKAAEVLHLSQSALTTRVQQLEEALDLRLFDRSTRSVDLTEAGRELLPVFLRVVNDLETAVVNARDHTARANSIIRMACLPSCAATLLPEVIRLFRAGRPDATFILEDAVNERVLSLVREGKVDFGVCARDGGEEDLDCQTLFEDNLQAVFSPSHPLSETPHITVAELTRYPLILTNRGSSVRTIVEQAFAARGMAGLPACEVNYMSSALALVRSGLGVAILPSTAIEVRAQDIVARTVEDPAFARTLLLVRRKGTPLPRIAAAFVNSLLASPGPT